MLKSVCKLAYHWYRTEITIYVYYIRSEDKNILSSGEEEHFTTYLINWTPIIHNALHVINFMDCVYRFYDRKDIGKDKWAFFF